jgi:predicted AAA+ superfamily ATPase
MRKTGTDILLRLSAYVRRPLIKGKTLIFFDEVQECKDIVTAIKFLVDEGSYRYIMSGSLLGVDIKDLRSVPVGYMDIKEMYPLDLEEFVEALGIGETVISVIRESWTEHKPVDDFIHKKLLELFRLYLIVGGMPAAVQKYLDTNNLQEVMAEQQAIIRLYKKDISKYDTGHKLYIEEIFDLIPPELNAKNKRFILKNLNENIKFSRYENSFIWLKDAGVALPVYNVEEPKVPLILSRSRNLFKLFQNDIGLLACQYSDRIQLRILNNEKDINFGSIYENFVAQELHAHGFDLYYFNSKKQGELDFVIEQNGQIVPIEVKSGKDYERHDALNNVMRNSDYDIQTAYVLCNDNLKVHGSVTYLPIYMLMFIVKTETAPVSYKIDLAGLNL